MSLKTHNEKHTVVFLSKEELEKPSSVVLKDDTNNFEGAILPNGEINWNCPCLGGMASGPCGYEFREAFSCFHNSKSEKKGSDCDAQFTRWQECMVEHLDYYGPASKSTDEKDSEDVDLTSISDNSNNSKSDIQSSTVKSTGKKS